MKTAPPPPLPPPARQPTPVLRLAFRPFYLLAAAAAVVNAALWALHLAGWVQLPSPLAPAVWHMHEMVFGFAAAVIVGFLFTAGRTWTGLPTPTGGALAAFAGLWLVARVAALLPVADAFFLLDVAFLPLVAATFTDLVVRSRNWRNAGVAAMLGAFAALNLVSHLAARGVIDLAPEVPLLGAVGLVVLLQTVIVGRIFPSFTMNALPGVKIAPQPSLDRLTIAATLLAVVVLCRGVDGALAGTVLALAGVLHAARTVRYRFWATLRQPVIWILHLAYAWVAIGFLLLAASAWHLVPRSPAVHALTVGAIGGLVFAMITRTARGHTARPQRASAAEVIAYGLVTGAAVVRVVLPIASPSLHGVAVAASAIAWCAAFAVYLAIYTPWLTAPRLDGREG